MTLCHKCGGMMGVKPSDFAGFDLLACLECGRPIKLVSRAARPTGTRPARRGDLNRALRAARRMDMRKRLP